MYSTRTGLVLGFHGCDESVAMKILTGEITIKRSVNSYDWLGNGSYFWENSPARALEFATHLFSKGKIEKPAVIGAVIDLGYCLDLLDYGNLQLLKRSFKFIQSTMDDADIPKNKTIGGIRDLLLRDLDCSVIEMTHELQRESQQSPFDTVRGVFQEGKELYHNARKRKKDHIQICVRNPNCIKGFFLPRTLDDQYPKL
jgi:hypothetical protein